MDTVVAPVSEAIPRIDTDDEASDAEVESADGDTSEEVLVHVGIVKNEITMEICSNPEFHDCCDTKQIFKSERHIHDDELSIVRISIREAHNAEFYCRL